MSAVLTFPKQGLRKIPGHDPGQEANLEKTYLREIKAIKGKTKKTLLAHGPTLQTKHTEQNNPLQGRNKTCLDLWGIQLWGAASNSNIEILQRFQSKTLRSLLNAPWYVTNETIHRDLKIPIVKDEIHKSRSRYNTRVNNHHNPLVTQLLDTTDQIRRLKRKYPLD